MKSAERRKQFSFFLKIVGFFRQWRETGDQGREGSMTCNSSVLRAHFNSMSSLPVADKPEVFLRKKMSQNIRLKVKG